MLGFKLHRSKPRPISAFEYFGYAGCQAQPISAGTPATAHLPFVKTFDQFDFAFQPSIDERQIRDLRTLRFVHEASNVILLGPPGVGKTYLSVALAEAAIQAGFGGTL